MSPNNGILFDGTLSPKLLYFIFLFVLSQILVFLLSHTAHFDDNIVLPFLVFNFFEPTVSVSFFSL